MYKPKIGITTGSLNGVGIEVILKSISSSKLLGMCTPIIFASSKAMDYYQQLLDLDKLSYHIIQNPAQAVEDKLNLINVWKDDVDIQPGNETTELDKYGAMSLVEACKAVQDKTIDAIVTAPIQKSSLKINGKVYVGHTDLFRSLFNAPQALMTMVSPQLRVALLTEHIPVSEISGQITKHNLIQTIRTFHKSLVEDFAIDKPRIATLGFNPHNGDGGLIGKEEKEIIIPTLKYIRDEEQILAFGPYSADGFWGFQKDNTFDGVLAMYHDQGLIPFKMKFVDIGVNYTVGLPFVRTSPDHGTALDIAGQNKANPDSMRHAIYLAIDIVRNKTARKEMLANPLKKQYLAEADSGKDE